MRIALENARSYIVQSDGEKSPHAEELQGAIEYLERRSKKAAALSSGVAKGCIEYGECQRKAIAERVRRETIEECAKVALAQEEWANDPGRLEEGERRLVIGTSQMTAREIRALAAPKGSAGT